MFGGYVSLFSLNLAESLLTSCLCIFIFILLTSRGDWQGAYGVSCLLELSHYLLLEPFTLVSNPCISCKLEVK